MEVTVDNKLSFEPHFNLVCKNVSQKLHALARVSKFTSKKSYHKGIILSQLRYSLLVWMCYSRTLINKINSLYERALRHVYDDRQSTFEEMLNIDKSVTIHHRNLQVLARELYKVHHVLGPELINDIFKNRNVTYYFRNNSAFETRNKKSVYYGTESISFLGPKIWERLPINIKDSENLSIFKLNIKSRKPENCPCRLCTLYIADIGFTRKYIYIKNCVCAFLCVRVCLNVDIRVCASMYTCEYVCVCMFFSFNFQEL